MCIWIRIQAYSNLVIVLTYPTEVVLLPLKNGSTEVWTIVPSHSPTVSAQLGAFGWVYRVLKASPPSNFSAFPTLLKRSLRPIFPIQPQIYKSAFSVYPNLLFIFKRLGCLRHGTVSLLDISWIQSPDRIHLVWKQLLFWGSSGTSGSVL